MARKPDLSRSVYLLYEQATGALSLACSDHENCLLGFGYSGSIEGLNDPNQEHRRAIGPIPAGWWQIGAAVEHPRLGPMALPLRPIGHDAHGRSAFYIHGDNRKQNWSASTGCIIAHPSIRRLCSLLNITKLRVIR